MQCLTNFTKNVTLYIRLKIFNGEYAMGNESNELVSLIRDIINEECEKLDGTVGRW